MSVAGTLELFWVDEKLIWEPADHEQITNIVLPVSEIWYPPIQLLNPSDGSKAINADARSQARIKANGGVFFYTSGVYIVNADLESTYYPFDQQVRFVFHHQVNLLENIFFNKQ